MDERKQNKHRKQMYYLYLKKIQANKRTKQNETKIVRT